MTRLEALGWAGLAVAGVACEALAPGALQVADMLTGLTLLVAGVVARVGRGESRVGPLLGLTSAVWFLGSIWPAAATAHLGPLAHALLSAPRGRLRGRISRAAVLAAYADGILQATWRNDSVTVAVALALAAAAAVRWLVAGGLARRAVLVPVVATLCLSLVLAGAAVGRLAGIGREHLFLDAYEAAVAVGALAVACDLARGRWEGQVVTGLVVDLGDAAGRGALRDAMARALGDATLEIGIWSPYQHAFVDERGTALAPLEGDRRGRRSTVVEQEGDPVAVIVHDAEVLSEPRLVESAAAALRVAVGNARLRAELHERIDELEASRLRLVESADIQRRLLARSLREGAEARLARVATLVSGLDPELELELDAARAELADLARGIHPSVLSECGLRTALEQLAARSPVPVTVTADEARVSPAVEAALYFVSSEALVNVAKHAGAHRATVALTVDDGAVRLVVCDDGVGGADPDMGIGLRGLADRIEALDGRLHIESGPGAGTTLVAEVPR